MRRAASNSEEDLGGTIFRRVFRAAGEILSFYKQASVDLARIEKARIYLHVIKGLHKAYIAVAALFVLIGFVFISFVMLHVFVLLWANDKALAGGLLFLADAIVSITLCSVLFSERNWMNYTNAHKWVIRFRSSARDYMRRHYGED
jgi:hypothetical protein